MHCPKTQDIASRVFGNISGPGYLGGVPSYWLEQREPDDIEAIAFAMTVLIKAGAPRTDGVLETVLEQIAESAPAAGESAFITVEDFHVLRTEDACGVVAKDIDPNMCAEEVAAATVAIAELASRAFPSARGTSAGTIDFGVLCNFIELLADRPVLMAVN